MCSDPDLRFDIDALFDHMIQNLDHDLSQEKDWCFSLLSQDYTALEEVAAEMEGEFLVQLAEPMESDENDTAAGLAELTLIQRAALTADEVKAIAETIESIAIVRGFQYEGVSCYDPIDATDLLDWMSPEDTIWRLRVITDSGLAENAELPWTFLVVMSNPKSLHQITDLLTADGYTDLDLFDEPDEQGHCGLCLFVAGRNDESALREEIARVTRHAETCGGELKGVQFYDRDEFDEVFGDGMSEPE